MGNIYEKMQSLMREIFYHDRKYYVESSPVISDGEYDSLFSELVELEGKYPDLADKNSPTSRVGLGILDSFPVGSHRVSMLSLSNIYSLKELNGFFDRVEKFVGGSTSYVVEPKIDGVSISLIYKDGRLDRALTRGDGRVGNYVTENVRTIRTLPLILSDSVSMELRGEIFFPRGAFKLFNEGQLRRGARVFANARNGAAGTIKLLDSVEVSKRPLDIFIYGLIGEGSFGFSASHFERLSYLGGLGFKVNPYCKLFSSRVGIEDYILFWEGEKLGVDYDTDGVVIKVDLVELQSRFGDTFRSPRWAIAYKFPSEQRSTVVEGIELSVGSTGLITPVAILESVELGNTLVSRASLHNFGELMKKDVRVSDRVFVEKGGEVIPQVSSVILSERGEFSEAFIVPSLCPSCGESLEDDIVMGFSCTDSSCEGLGFELRYRGKSFPYFSTSSGLEDMSRRISFFESSIYPDFFREFLVYRRAILPSISCPICVSVLDISINYGLRCLNLSCEAKRLRRISNFVSKDSMDIHGFGTKLVSLLLNEGIIRDYADIYNIEPSDIIGLEGFGEKSVKQLMLSIERSKVMPLNCLINGLGILNIGAKQAMVLADKYLSLDKLRVADLVELSDLIGQKAAINVVDFFRLEGDVIDRLKLGGVSFDSGVDLVAVSGGDSFFVGKKFVVTGVIEGLSRREVQARIKSLGGLCVSVPTKGTDYIIVGEGGGVSKLGRAKELGIEVLEASDFLLRLG